MARANESLSEGEYVHTIPGEARPDPARPPRTRPAIGPTARPQARPGRGEGGRRFRNLPDFGSRHSVPLAPLRNLKSEIRHPNPMSPPKRRPSDRSSRAEAHAPVPPADPSPAPPPARRSSPSRPGKPDLGPANPRSRRTARPGVRDGPERRLDRQAGRLGRRRRPGGRAGRPRGRPAGRPLDRLGTAAPPRPRRARPPVHQPGRLRPVPLARVDRDAPPREPRGPAAPGLAARLRHRPPRLPGLGPGDRPRPRAAARLRQRPQLDRPGRGLEAAERGPDRLRRPLAALPRLAPRAPAAAPGRRLAQDEVPGIPPGPADPLAALGPRPGGRRAGALDRAGRDRAQALGPPQAHPGGQARPRGRRPPPRRPSSGATWRSRTSPRRPSPWPATPTRASAGGTPAPGPAARPCTWPP